MRQAVKAICQAGPSTCRVRCCSRPDGYESPLSDPEGSSSGTGSWPAPQNTQNTEIRKRGLARKGNRGKVRGIEKILTVIDGGAGFTCTATRVSSEKWAGSENGLLRGRTGFHASQHGYDNVVGDDSRSQKLRISLSESEFMITVGRKLETVFLCVFYSAHIRD